MRKLRLPMVAAAFAVFLSTSANATPVTWSFYETAITSCTYPPFCQVPPQPFALMTLALPSETSTGTAFWEGEGSQPLYTGNSFALTIPVEMGVLQITPAFSGSLCEQTLNPSVLCEFDISWSEAAGNLTSVKITVNGTRESIGTFAEGPPFGLTGGAIASDHLLGGCNGTPCVVGGFWQSDLPAIPVPEPSSLAMLAAGLLGLLSLFRKR